MGAGNCSDLIACRLCLSPRLIGERFRCTPRLRTCQRSNPEIRSAEYSDNPFRLPIDSSKHAHFYQILIGEVERVVCKPSSVKFS